MSVSVTTIHESTRINTGLGHNPALVYLSGLESECGRRTMRQALDRIAALLSPGADALRFQHTTAIRSKLAETYAHSTANRMLSALRGVLKAAWRLGRMDAGTYHRAVDIQNVKGETVPAGRSITSGELSALMDTCTSDPSPAEVRDAAMIAILYSCGLRRGELVKPDLSDLDMETGALAVSGKTNRQRMHRQTGWSSGAANRGQCSHRSDVGDTSRLDG